MLQIDFYFARENINNHKERNVCNFASINYHTINYEIT